MHKQLKTLGDSYLLYTVHNTKIFQNSVETSTKSVLDNLIFFLGYLLCLFIKMKSVIKKLIHEPTQFTPDDAEKAINTIMQGGATESQISAFLVSLKLQQLDSDPRIVAACATALRSHARLIPYKGFDHLVGNVVDIVGTGGDGHDTYNVSTTASVVAAGAGAKVAKVSKIAVGG